MVQWTDILPTLIAAAGGKAPESIDGRSFLPVLRDPAEAHRDRIFTTHKRRQSHECLSGPRRA